ncbi:MAG: AEC family transporter [Candidatus Omnitrophota bacterium]
MDFLSTFFIVISAIAKLFILTLVGYILYRYRFIDEKFTDTLSLLLVRVLFPALIISKTIGHFSFSEYAYWWLLPVAGAVFSLTGMLLGAVFCGFLKGFSARREFISSCGFQNCGYLPMNLVLFLFAGAMGDRMLINVFLFILGFNVLMWSMVPLFLSGRPGKEFKISLLLNPPVLATVFALLWVAIAGKGSLPSLLAGPVKSLGQAAFPLAMLTLGAYLCKYRAHVPRNKVPLVACMVIKLLLFPMLIMAVLTRITIPADYKFLLFLQSIMPVAVSLVVIGSYTKADNKFLSSCIFYTHVASVFTIPIWLTIFEMVTG